jgi:predicted nuclease of predicted toxin-antitoxin system
VKLLLDENLYPRLIDLLCDLYPDSTHVHQCGLGGSNDTAIWDHAKANGFTIASKDSDFEARSVLLGPPPKIVWVRAGNCSTEELEHLLGSAVVTVRQFIQEGEETCLILGHQRSNK